jgi:hypothetical protein
MLYFKVPLSVNETGSLGTGIDSRYCTQTISISDTEAYVELLGNTEIKDDWVSISKEEWNVYYVPPVPTEPPVDEISQLKLDVATMQETINYLLGI